MNRVFRQAGSAGSVLMEYVVLCCFVGAAVTLAVSAGFYNLHDGYVGNGLGFVFFHRLRAYALSLPLP